MATFTSFSGIESHFANIARDAVAEASGKGYEELRVGLSSFYSSGGGTSSGIYNRTGQLRESARVTPVFATNNSAFAEVFIEPTEYKPAGRDAITILGGAEFSSLNMRGTGGFWRRYTAVQQELLNSAVQSRL